MKFFPAFLLIILFSCDHSTTDPFNVDIDKTAWQDDKMGCKGYRLKYLDAIQSNKGSFKNHSVREYIDFFGKPDERELYKRNKTYFKYYLSHTDCGTDKSRFLRIRFNATDRSDEIIIFGE